MTQIDNYIQKSSQKAIFFYRASGKYGFLSNLYQNPMFFERRSFPTSEHAYQFGKFRDKKIADWLMRAPKPHLVAILAHGLFAFDIFPNWSKIKVERMEKVLEAKFTQDKILMQKLLDTKNSQLIEKSSMDSFWGCGKKGNGKNMLGKLLMKVREKIRSGELFYQLAEGQANFHNYSWILRRTILDFHYLISDVRRYTQRDDIMPILIPAFEKICDLEKEYEKSKKELEE